MDKVKNKFKDRSFFNNRNPKQFFNRAHPLQILFFVGLILLILSIITKRIGGVFYTGLIVIICFILYWILREK